MSNFILTTANSAQDIDDQLWRRHCPPQHPFLNRNFFDILERHGTAGPGNGWQACHLVAKTNTGELLGFMPTYVKTNSHGDFTRDWSWASAYDRLGKQYYPKLLSAIPHTPAVGPRLNFADADTSLTAISAVKEWVRANRMSSWHVALPAPNDVELLHSQGLLVSHDVQFHWHNHDYRDFNDFLARFSSEKRRKVKAERRRISESGLAIEVRHGREVDPEEWPILHALYANTFDKYGNYAAFSSACFAELATTLDRNMVLFIARERGIPVALSICFRSHDRLYGRYWGSRGDFHSLHFELCFYQGIAYCIEAGLSVFEPGAGGEHKVSRGFEPTVVRSCHWIEDERMRHLIGDYLHRHRESVSAYAAEASSHLPFRKVSDA